jgi:inosine-uridine nucleoside N-ribohydrolase
VYHRGDWRDVEWNAGRDPAATAAFLATKGDHTLVPLDVTVHTRMSPAAVDRLVSVQPILRDMIASTAVVLHDPAALLVLLGDALASFATRYLMCDGRGRLVDDAGAPPCTVVTDLDGDAVVDRVLDLLAP